MNDKATEEAKPKADISTTEKDKIDDGETEKMNDSVAPKGGKADVPVVQDAEVAHLFKGNEMEDQVSSEAADQSISSNPEEITKGSNGTSAQAGQNCHINKDR